MSTFDGNVIEFPNIRIDYFRPSDSEDSQPALAYFLSHVHSDHLVGLESCKSPFIYCSPATRDILLRLEKYPHRMNFAKGILETRKQTYRHLKNLLKAIPLETPTVIELRPGKEIRVTLFDANHCVGAVMFLIEGDGKAVLYTGDIRSELWWVNALTRSPMLLPYAAGSEKKLDCIYLDTTFVVTGKEDPYAVFPSKADGLSELLRKVAEYPKDTLFYFDAWTFGYEDVWQALSTSLGSRIHVDDYRYDLYRALANGLEPKAPEASKLMGFYCGNHFQEGCLTTNQSRIHSCEKAIGCEIWTKDFVRITPIVSRHNGAEIAELGVGGGQGDLNQQHELEVVDTHVVGQLMAMCASKLNGQPQLLSGVLHMLTSLIDGRVQSIKLEDFNLTAELGNAGSQEHDVADLDDLPLEKLVPALARVVTKMKQKQVVINESNQPRRSIETAVRADGLPKHITFPYSRHASYNELCYLIEAFKPKDIHPCTVDEAAWAPSSSMSFLFGHLYDVPLSIRHDQKMLKKKGINREEEMSSNRPVASASSSSAYATPKNAVTTPEAGPMHRATSSNKMSDRKNSKIDDPPDESEDQRQLIERTRHRPESQGDVWPPERNVLIDHYSPPRGRKRRRSSTAESREMVQDDDASDSPVIDTTAHASHSRREKSWRKRLAEAMPPDWQHKDDSSSTRKPRGRLSLDYGRLNARRIPSDIDAERMADQDYFETLAQRRRPNERLQSSADVEESTVQIERSPSANESRLAFRQEVHDAVLNREGTMWSDIGLVSVNGHQVKEEAL